MFNLFGGRRKANAQPPASKASTQVAVKSEETSTEFAPEPIGQHVAVLEAPTPAAEQQVAVLETPPPVEKPKVLSPVELLRQEIDGEAISFEDICANLTRTVKPRDPEVIASEKNALESRLGRTYGVEAAYRERLKQEIALLTVELAQVELDRNYLRIDTGFLQRRKWSAKYNCPLPLFAAFAIDDPECLIHLNCNRDRGTWKIVVATTCKPQVITDLIYLENMKKHVQDLFEAEYRRSHREGVRSEVSLKAIFAGTIPDATREKIDQAKTRFDELFLVTEAPEWEMAVKVTPAPIPVRDPLVIGRKGDQFWLVDAFNLTPLEAAIKGEWTTDNRDK